jgi:flagellar hook-basal body complex protein FliE
MVALLRAHADVASGKVADKPAAGEPGGFGAVLKTSLDQVNQTQQTATRLAQDFETGAPNVSLTDVMVSMQKANIAFQATVQVRNKLVSAYHDIMNMQV